MASKTRRVGIRPHPNPEKGKEGIKIEAEFLNFKIINEAPCLWELEDGSVLKARLILEEVFYAFDLDTKEMLRGTDGSPIYGIAMAMRPRVEPSEKVFKKEKEEG